MFHADVRAKAETATGLNAYPGYIPQGTTLPAIAYTVNFSSREATTEIPEGVTRRNVKFFIQTRSYDELEAAAVALHTAFNGFGGTMGDTHAIRGAKLIEDESELIATNDPALMMFGRQMSFEISHR